MVLLRHAHRAGVTRAVAIPSSSSVFIGYGTYISTGAENKLDKVGNCNTNVEVVS